MGGSWQTQKASADLSIFQLILFESLAPFCNGEPSSSSTLVVFCQSPCAVFPYLFCQAPPFFEKRLYRKKNASRKAGVFFTYIH